MERAASDKLLVENHLNAAAVAVARHHRAPQPEGDTLRSHVDDPGHDIVNMSTWSLKRGGGVRSDIPTTRCFRGYRKWAQHATTDSTTYTYHTKINLATKEKNTAFVPKTLLASCLLIG